MNIRKGEGRTRYGAGVSIDLSSEDIFLAITAYLISHDVHIDGARTITVNGSLVDGGHIYVDPSARVIHKGELAEGSRLKDGDCQ